MENTQQQINHTAQILCERLLHEGFKIHRYDAHGSNSVYLKLDCGASNSIRISDHPGKRTLHYRFNITTTVKEVYTQNDGEYVRSYYPINMVEQLIRDIVALKQKKLKLYGDKRYKEMMQMGVENSSNTRGFWSHAREINLADVEKEKRKKNNKQTIKQPLNKKQIAII